MSSPQVSVIIPNYNGSKYLRESIDSALDQQGVNVEVIVVDDGSTDNSLEILESYENKIRIYCQENRGAPAARNLGWNNAGAEFIKFLDSDDVLMPDTLKKQYEASVEVDQETVVYGQAKWVDENLNETFQYDLIKKADDEHPIAYLISNNPLTASPLHRKQLLEKVKGFKEGVVKGQEFDLHLRLGLSGVKFQFIDSPVYLFRQTDNPSRISYISLSENAKKLHTNIKEQISAIKSSPFGGEKEVLISIQNRLKIHIKGLLLNKAFISVLPFFWSWIKLEISIRIK